jgi:hypothetical protein
MRPTYLRPNLNVESTVDKCVVAWKTRRSQRRQARDLARQTTETQDMATDDTNDLHRFAFSNIAAPMEQLRLLDDEHRQWLIDTDTEVRSRWMKIARRELYRLFKRKSNQVLLITWELGLYVALDPTILDILNFSEAVNNATRIDIFWDKSEIRWRGQFRKGDAIWKPEMPPSAVNYVAAAIARALRAQQIVGITSLTASYGPAAVTAGVLMALPVQDLSHIEVSFKNVFQEDIGAVMDGLRRHGPSLTTISCSGFHLEALRLLGPVIISLPKLSKLSLWGFSPLKSWMSIEATEDAQMLCQIIKKESIKDLSLYYIHVDSIDAAVRTCHALRETELNVLSAQIEIKFPVAMEHALVTALAKSRIRHLRLTTEFVSEAILAFAPAFAASKRVDMVELSIHGGRGMYFKYNRKDGLSTSGLPEDWVNQVMRTLTVHQEWQKAVPVMEIFQSLLESNGCARFADVFACHPAVVFECLRCNKYKLRKLIQELDGYSSTGRDDEF